MNFNFKIMNIVYLIFDIFQHSNFQQSQIQTHLLFYNTETLSVKHKNDTSMDCNSLQNPQTFN